MARLEGRGTIVCRSCGGAVPVDAARCAYCGGRVELPKPAGSEGPAERRTYCTRCATMYPADAARCPRCPPASGEDRGGRCPRCAAELSPETMGPVTVDRCRGCRGRWFDGNELERVIDLTTEGVPRDDATRMRLSLPAWVQPSEIVRYLACVRCGERMVRRQAAPKAGIVVDVCAAHGVWFDANEFEHFAAFARAGGLEVLRNDGIASAEARRTQAAQRARLGAPLSTRDPLDPSGSSAGTGLTHEVLRAIRGLFGSRAGW